MKIITNSINNIEMKDNTILILGSKSPRRAELMKGLGLVFSVVTFETDERYPSELEPEEVAQYVAMKKAEPFMETLKLDQVVLTSDTVVIAQGLVLGKPKNREAAVNMLLQLSGKKHKVITGVVLTTLKKQISISETTTVEFDLMSMDEINYYIDNYSPYDKAGSYGIQEWIGYAKVKQITGCYYNVMGLPLNAVYKLLLQEKIIK